uniref:adipocyte plasma membrane-associated protein-like n=1 Tax=Styela clava TaxID=7725 RepID=UPI0019399D13|nr:adipocyte plasma membrane-associated protein-like [Styela clava]
MDNRKELRQRSKTSKKDTPHKRTGDENALQGSTSRNTITFVVKVVIAALSAYLCCAYFTSPTSSVVVNDMHNIGQLKWANMINNDLQSGEKLFTELIGPESIAVDKVGNWYAGLEDGRIMKISNSGKVLTELTKSFDFAKGSKRVDKRIMGLRLFNSKLFFADAYQGIFVIDILTKEWKKIVGFGDVNPNLMFANDLTITADGSTIYFTDTSEKWDYKGAAYSIIEVECSGRLFKVDLTTKSVDLLRERLCFANGIELDLTESKLLLSENSRRRILVFDIKSGEILKQILLPGGPDNIRRSRDGGFWAPIPVLPDPSFDIALPFPVIRDTLTGAISLETLFKLLKMNKGVVVKISSTFEPEAIHYDLDGKVCQAISHVCELDTGELLLGTVTSRGIVRLKL